MRNLLLAVSIALGLGAIAAAAETPKRGGTLTYVIAAEGVPHLDAHIYPDSAGTRTNRLPK